ncbi:hypothetical protein [Janthinobacterium sp.]|uniref:hypothetical protein n=1 Tax=Janthinobacterium sp. TaxID=1871054 RepID=UPI00293D90E7|nr:hypothetical protein [Janthinobacterium sp.]
MTELRRFRAAERGAAAFLRDFGLAVRAALAGDARLEALPVAPLQRAALGVGPGWDLEQSVFPFLLFRLDAAGARRPLGREETRELYLRLQDGAGGRRYQLGQPVNCGMRDGVPVSALRLCVSARMIADAADDAQCRAALIEDVGAALEQLLRLLDAPVAPLKTS